MDKLNQAQTNGVVIGLKDVADVVPRLDVDQLLLQEPDTFNLFLIALGDLQQDPNITDIMSYYQVAGIHGLPKALWDGVDLARKHSDDLDPNDWSGYCSHGTVLFPTWHRPYLAMIEQTIYSKMLEKAKDFGSQADRYRQAAQKFRLPYWDYFRPRAHRTTAFPGIVDNGTTSFPYDFSVPQIFTLQQIMIDLPGKGLTLQPNPLNFFNFPSGGIPDEQFNVYAQGFSEIRTLRYPTTDQPDQDDSATMNDTINRERESNVKQIINMVSDPGYQVYKEFATHTRQRDSSGSLEDIHGTYHGLIGGPMDQGVLGHMATVPVAAFDPIFWFHHCQIDRWAAIWQAIHPDTWFVGQDQDLELQDLLPFRTSKSNDPNNTDTFWNSNDSRNLEPFGYTYPDVQFGSPDEVKAEFNRKYEWSYRVDGVRDFGDCPPDMQPLDLSGAQVYQFPSTHAVVHSFSKAVASAHKTVTSSAEAVTKATVGETTKGKAEPARALPKAAAPKSAKPAAAKDTPEQGRAFTNLPAQSPLLAPRNYDESKISREWFVDIVVERLALNGAFTIYYFIGPFSNNISDYKSAPTMAGLSHIFVAPVETCDHCGRQDQQGIEVTSTAPVTPILLDYVKLGELENLSPEKVKPFLVQMLKWRVVSSKGERVDPRTVRGLKVGISSKLTPIPVGSGSVTYEEYPEIVEEILANED